MAVDKEELPRLEALHKRGIQNEVPGLRVVGPDEIKQIEPYCQVSLYDIETWKFLFFTFDSFHSHHVNCRSTFHKSCFYESREKWI